MDDPSSFAPSDDGEPDRGRRDGADPAAEGAHDWPQEQEDGGRLPFPMPSPWVAAFAVIALLAFGVGLGLYTRPEESSSPVLLASAPAAIAGATTTTSTSTAASQPEETTTKEESSGGEEEPEAKEEASSEEKSSSSHKEPSSGEEESSGRAEEGSGGKGAGSKGSGAGSGSGSGSGSEKGSSALPPIKHVFVIVLGDQGYEAMFGGASQAPYLAKTLRQQGELIGDYFGVTSGELANEIALISGQGPTPQTAAGCGVYEALSPGTAGSEGQALGNGCVYPISSLTLGDQLTAAGQSWKAYVQGLGEGSAPAGCPHPALGASDPASAPSATAPFVTWRDPFLYFKTVIESSNCAQENVGIAQLAKDLASTTTTPALSYIAPDPCEDGSAEGCGGSGAPAGMAGAEGFLHRIVPEIQSSAAYKEGGMIAITADQAPQTGAQADTSGCCATPKFPNLPSSTPTTTPTGLPLGGGRAGLLLISKYVKPGSVDTTNQYNHFSLLASIEALFKLKPLGYAGNVQLPTFEKAVYNAYS